MLRPYHLQWVQFNSLDFKLLIVLTAWLILIAQKCLLDQHQGNASKLSSLSLNCYLHRREPGKLLVANWAPGNACCLGCSHASSSPHTNRDACSCKKLIVTLDKFQASVVVQQHMAKTRDELKKLNKKRVDKQQVIFRVEILQFEKFQRFMKKFQTIVTWVLFTCVA